MNTNIKTNTLVDTRYIENAKEDEKFIVPDVSGTIHLNKRIAHMHAMNGIPVFVVVGHFYPKKD